MRWRIAGAALAAAWWAGCAASDPAGGESRSPALRTEPTAGDSPSPGDRTGPAPGGGDDVREARQEVLEAEAERREDAFRERLARLRAEEEARAQARAAEAQRARTSTSALAAALGALTAPAEELVLDSADRGEGKAEGPDRGESARPVSGPTSPPPPAVEPLDPTPRLWLDAAVCLSQEEQVAVQKRMAEARLAGKPRAVQAEWALALVESQALLADIQSERAHRGLANRAPSCATPPTEPVLGLLRALYGRGARGGTPAPGVVRATERLRSHLEVRAGLPRLNR